MTKNVIEFRGYTITNRIDGSTALIFKGTNLTDKELNGTELIVKCIAGNRKEIAPNKWTHNAIEKAKQFIITTQN